MATFSQHCICGAPTERKCSKCDIKSYCKLACERLDEPQHQFQCDQDRLIGTLVDEYVSDHEFFREHRDTLTSDTNRELFERLYLFFRTSAVERRVTNAYMLYWCYFMDRKVAAIYITQEPDKLYLFSAPTTPPTRISASTDSDQSQQADDRVVIVVSTDEYIPLGSPSSDGPSKSILYAIRTTIPDTCDICISA